MKILNRSDDLAPMLSEGTIYSQQVSNMSHFCKLSLRKKVLKNSRQFISLERHIRNLIQGAYCLDLLSKYDFPGNNYYEFSLKVTEIVIYVLQYYLDDERCWQKAQNYKNCII